MITIPDKNSPDSGLESHPVPPLSPPLDLKLFTPIPHYPNTHSPLSYSTIPTLSSSPPPPTSPVSNDPPSRFPRDIHAPLPMNDLSLNVSLDDENLSSVERIYLLCISKETIHRVFIARSLHIFLPDVAPVEAVEYVLPHLNTLAVDEEDAVKEALASNLVSIMWWFFENCQLVDYESSNNPSITDQVFPQEGPALLPVQSFTPILGSLLIDFNPTIGGPARFAVVDILNRIHAANAKDEDRPLFGTKERQILEEEIIHQVIIGMGRLELSDEYFPSPVLRPEVQTLQSPPGMSVVDPPVFTSPLAVAFPSSLDLLPNRNVPEAFTGPLSPPLLNLPPPVSADVLPAKGTSPDVPSSVASLTPPLSDNNNNPFEPWPETSASQQSNNATEDESLASVGRHHPMEEQQIPQDTEWAAIGRLSSMSLIATVTAHVELPEDTIRAFAEEVVYIGKDSLYMVRHEAAFAVGALAKVAPIEVLQLSLLPLFKSLSRDSIWNVRHSSVFALPNILARLPQQQRLELALQTLLYLSNDESTVVKTAVLKVLGEVIYTFHEDEGGAPTQLVDLFVGKGKSVGQHRHETRNDGWLSHPFTSKSKEPPGLNEHNAPSVLTTTPPAEDHNNSFKRQESGSDLTREELSRDVARSIITSFNFPAVTLALGPERWHEISNYYYTLSTDENPRVRRTIAASLGEMARILGSRIAESDLLDTWQDMVHDSEDGIVRLKALTGLPQFVTALEGSARETVMGSLVGLWEQWLTGWREKECLTNALPELAVLAGNEGEAVCELMSKALTNNVAAVREAGIRSLGDVLQAFEPWPHLAERLREDIQSLARYVACLCALVDKSGGETELLKNNFWETIDRLSQDDMTDVRIGVARLMGILCEKYLAQVLTVPLSLFVVERLSRDLSRDVREFVAFLQVSISKLELRIIPRDNNNNNNSDYRDDNSVQTTMGTLDLQRFPALPDDLFRIQIPLISNEGRLDIRVRYGCGFVKLRDVLMRFDRKRSAAPAQLVPSNELPSRWRHLKYYQASSSKDAHSLRAGLTLLFTLSIICIISAVNLGSLQPDTESFQLVRKNAFISRVIVEISWLTVLWLLNISGAAALTSVSGQLHCIPNGIQSSTACSSSVALLAFSWLNTVAMLLYLLALVGSSTYHSQDNTNIWNTGVRDFKWFTKHKQIPKQLSPASEPSFMYGRLTDPANNVRAPVPPIYAQQMGLAKDFRIEPLRIPNLPQIATPPNVDLPTVPAAATTYLGRMDSYNSRGTPIVLRTHTIPSLYPEHLQSTRAPVNPRLLTGSGEHSPPPAGYWPRKNPQEPLRPKHSKRKPRTQSADEIATGGEEQQQLDSRSRPTGPRTIAPVPRLPTLDITRTSGPLTCAGRCVALTFLSLLFLVNLFSLTVASLTIATLKGQGHKATAGSVLIILGFIFYALVAICIWSETCISRSRLSTSRTEAIILPVLFVFQIIGAIVATADAAKGASSCVALVVLSWMSAFTLLVYYFIIMIVTFYHFSFNENIWNESPLGYDWFPMPPSEFVFPSVPPKDTNFIPNPPMDASRPPSIEIASIEPPPPRSQGRHQPQVSSWMSSPLDPDMSRTQLPSKVPGQPLRSTEVFEDIPISQSSRFPETETTPKFSLNDYISRLSSPQWAKKLRPTKRGVELPFPVAATNSARRYPIRLNEQAGMERIDAPVAPTIFTDATY
ncbi:hypothetical protein Clacol_006316 [Clathrus columnatus]|uniref:ARM repeat-containing protein n=1 Tax=Clathrus columnatus TaxID=1419009 RepID=A0AAV5ACJ7_9AGAM|nr:hypothetical protein Clacol_006316 [Clathrus columnatus]